MTDLETQGRGVSSAARPAITWTDDVPPHGGMVGPPPGLRERKKRKLRTELVRVALQLFEAQGYEQTTVEDIAAAADVSPRTFFRYFARKEDVLLVDRDRKLEVMRAAVEHPLPGEHMLDAVCRAVTALACDYAADREMTAALFRLATSEPVVAARMLEFQIGWEQALAAELAEHLEMAPDDLRPQIIAHTALTTARLGMAEWLRSGAVGDPGSEVAATFAIAEPALRVLLEQR